MAGAPYRLVTLPDGTQRRMPSSQAEDFINNTFLPNQSFENSATATIPGFTGPRGTGSVIPGLLTPTPMAPPQPTLQQQPTQFQPMGRYGAQAMMLSGLLGGQSQIPQQPGAAQGLLANPAKGRPRMMYGK